MQTRPRLQSLATFLLAVATLAGSAQSSLAGSATWKTNAQDSSWFTSANWTPATVPNGPTDVASFAVTNLSFITGMGATLSQIDFAANASTYQITLDVGIHSIVGVGVTGNGEKFILPRGEDNGTFAELDFTNTAAAGSSQYIIDGSDFDNLIPPVMVFRDSSTAGSSIIALDLGKNAGLLTFGDSSTADLVSCFNSGNVYFSQSATAAQGYFEIEGAIASGGRAGFLQLGDTSTGGTAQFVVEGGTVSGAPGGVMEITASASADSAAIFANNGSGDGGLVMFVDSSTTAGGMATFQINGNGRLDISGAGKNPAIGALSGDGQVFLGKRKLTAGRNLASTTFNGLLQDGGISGGTGGSFAKVGSGTLTLSGANTYTGSTSLNGGTLKLINTTGSATGTGAVQANAGDLGGSATIAGAVTIGANNSDRPHLSPATGSTVPGSLTMLSSLTFNSNGGYNYLLRASGRRVTADRVTAKGITINPGASLTLLATVQGTLAPGTSATVLSNTSATPISGTFSNLADGAIVTVGTTKFQANYEGGDGNDLTLTVVP